MTVKTKLIWNGDEAKFQGRKIINKSPFESGIIVQGQIVALCPRDTNRLAGSYVVRSEARENKNQYTAEAKTEDIIPTTKVANEAVVGTNVKYGPHVEFGTVKQKAQPHVRPAFDLSQGKTLTVFLDNGRIEFKDFLQ